MLRQPWLKALVHFIWRGCPGEKTKCGHWKLSFLLRFFSQQLLPKIETKPGYFPWSKTAKKIDQKKLPLGPVFKKRVPYLLGSELSFLTYCVGWMGLIRVLRAPDLPLRIDLKVVPWAPLDREGWTVPFGCERVERSILRHHTRSQSSWLDPLVGYLRRL